MTPSPARLPTGRTTRSSSRATARCSRASCRRATASTARSASAAHAGRPSAAPAACASTANPRDDQHYERLNDLAQDPHGLFDCTHCFKCVEACPKDVNPMGQIMRLRRIATSDHHIVDRNNGERHEAAFTTLIRDYGLNHEAELLPRSYGGNSWFGKLHPAAAKALVSSLPVAMQGLLRGKVSPLKAIFGHRIPKEDLKAVRSIYDRIEGREQRYELNLYIAGSDEDAPPAVATSEGTHSAPGPEGATATADGEGAPAAAEEERS